jgi:hypothetical protein
VKNRVAILHSHVMPATKDSAVRRYENSANLDKRKISRAISRYIIFFCIARLGLYRYPPFFIPLLRLLERERKALVVVHCERIEKSVTM